ncbi:hypothetical protein PISMIDRAFT_116972 [Pisolithus microcarpus 441]|uniref:Uncharacterized protein n=1 Tax=Pisolithus microcarpus 441 TaxID=765257 RepID=A0A0C9YCS0_9AGAM|nr:hypothetical protein BKA83DRAFT_116972 [Pisolithus microcarpus]KIK14481.1 hypothetical protein PISMIDRAFT_116972 [Pisolithus microcarpus 441]
MCFLCSQLHNNSDCNILLPDLSGSLVSVLHSAILTFYAPSGSSGLSGMHSECIQSTPCWHKHPACYNTVFLEWDLDIPGMGGLCIGQVFLFFTFIYNNIISDKPNENTGMWIVQPDYDADRVPEMDVVHIHSILHGAHLIPVYGHAHLLADIQYTNSLDVFQAYYVNKYIDHDAFEITF